MDKMKIVCLPEDQRKPGVSRPAGQVKYNPEELEEMLGITFFDSHDDLDHIKVAVVKMNNGKQFVLRKHKHDRSTGTFILIYDYSKHVEEDLRDALSAMGLVWDDLVWMHDWNKRIGGVNVVAQDSEE
ncbi:hypothetical protein [Desulfatibacillum aliphaticivorans]|uniref:hypothetical protein n=1 Tax=Desulfatibacillum aliphaticivorans TaxID=218208 RepID=UPI0005C24957|nr:hypothetical protein [Desulfatibacillum aliphaticivorans]